MARKLYAKQVGAASGSRYSNTNAIFVLDPKPRFGTDGAYLNALTFYQNRTNIPADFRPNANGSGAKAQIPVAFYRITINDQTDNTGVYSIHGNEDAWLQRDSGATTRTLFNAVRNAMQRGLGEESLEISAWDTKAEAEAGHGEGGDTPDAPATPLPQSISQGAPSTMPAIDLRRDMHWLHLGSTTQFSTTATDFNDPDALRVRTDGTIRADQPFTLNFHEDGLAVASGKRKAAGRIVAGPDYVNENRTDINTHTVYRIKGAILSNGMVEIFVANAPAKPTAAAAGEIVTNLNVLLAVPAGVTAYVDETLCVAPNTAAARGRHMVVGVTIAKPDTGNLSAWARGHLSAQVLIEPPPAFYDPRYD